MARPSAAEASAPAASSSRSRARASSSSAARLARSWSNRPPTASPAVFSRWVSRCSSTCTACSSRRAARSRALSPPLIAVLLLPRRSIDLRRRWLRKRALFLTLAPRVRPRRAFLNAADSEEPRCPRPSRSMANAIRVLSMDAVHRAKSGHQGMPHGHGRRGHGAVHEVPEVRRRPARLGRPRPLRAVGRPRLDAALLPAAPDRLQGGDHGADRELPAARAPTRRATRSTAIPRASRPPPARWARAWPPPSAWPWPSGT